MRHRRQVLPLLLVLTLAASHRAGAQRPGPGTHAPDFSLTALDSTMVQLAGLRGHPVVINFWATTCPPCVLEMPALGERFLAHRSEGLIVLAVNGEGEKEKTVRQFTERLALPFPVLLDPPQRVMTSYEVIRFPVTIFVDSAGVIRYRHDGPIQPGQLDAGLRAILPGS